MLPWQWVLVRGPSMVPTLRDGDRVIARHSTTFRPGDVVLATYRSMPGILVVKRVVEALGDGWWLASDNAFAGGGSDRHGVADIRARVVLRIRGVRVTRL